MGNLLITKHAEGNMVPPLSWSATKTNSTCFLNTTREKKKNITPNGKITGEMQAYVKQITTANTKFGFCHPPRRVSLL